MAFPPAKPKTKSKKRPPPKSKPTMKPAGGMAVKFNPNY